MNRIILALLGRESYVASLSTTKKKVAVPVVLPAVYERAAEVNAGTRVEPVVDTLGEALISLSRVHFGSQSAMLQPSALKTLAEAADRLRYHPDVHLFVDGHADERGMTDYNFFLSNKRARVVVDYLILLGISSERLRSVPRSDEHPLVIGVGEYAWAANRRVDFRLMRGDVRLEVHEGQMLDDRGMPLGARSANDNATVINPVAG